MVGPAETRTLEGLISGDLTAPSDRSALLADRFGSQPAHPLPGTPGEGKCFKGKTFYLTQYQLRVKERMMPKQSTLRSLRAGFSPG